MMIITPRMILESLVNVLGGEQYYKRFVLPTLIKHGGKRPVFSLSYDIDEEKDITQIPWLLKMLKKHKIKASFAVIGKHVEKHPKLYKKIITEGHELINHTYSHPDNPEFNPHKHFHKITPQERFKEIQQCDTVVKRMLGYTMKGFRVPHFGYQFTSDIYPMLSQLKYVYSSSTVAIREKRGSKPYKIKGIWEFPVSCCPKHPYCIFDTSHAFRAKVASHSPEEYLATFEKLLATGIQHNLFMNIYQDPQDLHRFDYEKMLGMVSGNQKNIFIEAYSFILKNKKQW